MASKWIIIVYIIQCLFLTGTDTQPSITLNGNSSIRQIYELNDNVTIICKVSPSYTSISSYYIQRSGRSYHYIGSSNTGSTTRTITCDDNTYYRCYGRFNGTYMYSTNIYVTVDCSPTWAESVKVPVIYYAAQSSNKYFDLLILGQPSPTYSVHKYTPSGLQDLAINVLVDVFVYTNKVRLYFRTYSEESHGIYHIVANNTIGMLTANVTFRGLTLPPKYVRAWSTTPNSIHVEWTAGELFETAPQYYLYYKSQNGKWGTKVTVSDIGSTVTYIFNTFKPNTTYYFLVAAYTPQFSTSVYSNLAQATTLTNPSDPPQTMPPLYKTTVKPTLSPVRTTIKRDVNTEVKGVTNDSNKVCEQGDLTFGAGIGTGIGIGLMLVIIAVMGTIIYFKRSPSKQDEIPMASQNHTTQSDRGRSDMNVTDGLYEQLRHPVAGVAYDNQACEQTQ